jgi:hypothetical protein
MKCRVLRWLMLSLGTIVIGFCLASGAVSAYFFFKYKPLLSDLQHARLTLKKEITASIDSRFPVNVAFDHLFKFRLQKNIPLELPIQTTLQVPVDETFLIPIADSFAVEMDSPLFIDEQIRVHSEMPLDITVQTRILGMDLSVPIQGSVPIDITFPLQQQIGVKGALSLRVTEPLRVHIRQTLEVPVRFVMRGVLPVNEEIMVPIQTMMEGQVAIRDPLPCTVEMNMSTQDWGRGIRISR